MSSEFDDIAAGLQRESQPSAPSAEPPALGAEPVRGAEAPNPAPGANEANDGPPGPPAPLPCARCGAPVPEGAGRCPGCGTFQKANVESVVHGLRSKRLAKIVDAYRVDLIEQLFAERGGREVLDVISRIAIENYALVCAQHKTIEARLDQDGLFTQTGRRRNAFDMLKGISETIDRLRAALPPPITRTRDDGHNGVEQMPLSALHLAQDLLNRHETLTDRELGQLDVLQAALHGEVLLPPDPVDVPVLDDVVRGTQAPADAATEAPVPTAPAAPSQCEWCHQAPCVGRDHHGYDALHAHDPEHVAARDQARTDEMLESLGRERTGGIRRW